MFHACRILRVRFRSVIAPSARGVPPHDSPDTVPVPLSWPSRGPLAACAFCETVRIAPTDRLDAARARKPRSTPSRRALPSIQPLRARVGLVLARVGHGTCSTSDTPVIRSLELAAFAVDEGTYAVVTALGPIVSGARATQPGRNGMSHAQAMRLAEELRQSGEVATVMHVVGGKSYEVDRYPAR
jgi:hypothetical protein